MWERKWRITDYLHLFWFPYKKKQAYIQISQSVVWINKAVVANIILPTGWRYDTGWPVASSARVESHDHFRSRRSYTPVYVTHDRSYETKWCKRNLIFIGECFDYLGKNMSDKFAVGATHASDHTGLLISYNSCERSVVSLLASWQLHRWIDILREETAPI